VCGVVCGACVVGGGWWIERHIGLGRTLVVKGTNKIFVLIPMYVLRVFYGYLKTYLSHLKVIVL
jgi:hypothetical protein